MYCVRMFELSRFCPCAWTCTCTWRSSRFASWCVLVFRSLGAVEFRSYHVQKVGVLEPSLSECLSFALFRSWFFAPGPALAREV